MSQAILYGVGVGPGDPELLTLKAIRTIESCSVVAAPQTAGGGSVALEIVRQAVDLSGKELLLLPFAMSRDPDALEQSRRKAAALLTQQLAAGHSIAMLNLGDVSIYATFHYMKALVEAQGYATAMIPGVPSFCAVAATLGENLTPQMNSPLHIIPAGFEALDTALAFPGTKVIMKAGIPLAQVKETLRTHGLYHKAKLVQNCGLPNQQVAHTLDAIEEKAGYFTTMVVKP